MLVIPTITVSKTFKDLVTQIQGLPSTNPVFKYATFKGLNTRGKNSRSFKNFQGCEGTLRRVTGLQKA